KAQLLHRNLKHWRVHRTRVDRIAADVFGRVLESDGTSDRPHSALAGRVRGSTTAAKGRGRSQIDNRSTAGALEVRNPILAEEEDAPQVDRDGAVENLFRHIDYLGVLHERDAVTIRHRGELAKPGYGQVDCTLDIFGA